MPGKADLDLRRELSVMRRPAVLLALATTALASAAMFTVFTYIAPILQQVGARIAGRRHRGSGDLWRRPDPRATGWAGGSPTRRCTRP